ncbi:MAG: UDP-N-acetylmuramoyl-L-alanine--D-glutamate ligase [Myxococcota bacterium]
MPSLAGARILVLGLGATGRSAALFFAERGARVVAADEREDARLAAELPPEVEVRLGAAFPDPAEFDCVVPSPGVPPERYAGRARDVRGDIEWAADALPVPIVAVTGTNGKSTTTLLVAALLRAAGLRVGVGGNVGIPALSLVGEALDVAVLEVSSFQLETTQAFRPRVAVVLNLTPDHLDRHGDFAAYRNAKLRILANQRDEDWAVLNAEDAHVAAFVSAARGRVLAFAADRAPQPEEAFAATLGLDAGELLLQERAAAPRRLPFDWRQPGRHNRENALAAIGAVHALGADLPPALGGLAGFEGLPHRHQIVSHRGGVTWVDDSKATNPGAALRALEGCGGPVIWIGGGRAKGLDLAELAAGAQAARAALLIGEAAPALAAALGDALPVHAEPSLEDAVRRAAQIARPGDWVLLAPGCSSHDQFANFEDRGRRFQAAVGDLPPVEDDR